MDSYEENHYYNRNGYLQSKNTTTSSVVEEFVELVEEAVHWLILYTAVSFGELFTTINRILLSRKRIKVI